VLALPTAIRFGRFADSGFLLLSGR